MKIPSGHLNSWRNVEGTAGLEEAFAYLESIQAAAPPVGKYEILGDSLFAMVSEVPSRAPETGLFEAHRKYIDVHYLISGTELIGVAPTDQLALATEYDAVKDISFYALPPDHDWIELRPGDFAVLYPEHAHLPLCHLAQSADIRKVVLKVAVANARG